MRFVLDTNILVRLVEPSHPQHDKVGAAMRTLRMRENAFYVFMQNISEFWNVCTRPTESNGIGLPISETNLHLARFEQLFSVLPDTSEVYQNWRELVVAHSVSGVKVHDAKIVAGMMAHRIDQLLTLNIADFKRYGEISAISPEDI